MIAHQPQGNKEQNLAHWVSLSMDSHPHCSELQKEYSFYIICVDQEVICGKFAVMLLLIFLLGFKHYLQMSFFMLYFSIH